MVRRCNQCKNSGHLGVKGLNQQKTETLSNTLSTNIADAFINKFICVFGAPKVILTDQGQNILSNSMIRVTKRCRIKKIICMCEEIFSREMDVAEVPDDGEKSYAR